MANAVARGFPNYPFEDLKDATHDFAEAHILGEAPPCPISRLKGALPGAMLV